MITMKSDCDFEEPMFCGTDCTATVYFNPTISNKTREGLLETIALCKKIRKRLKNKKA